jgi:hypothetical protein
LAAKLATASGNDGLRSKFEAIIWGKALADDAKVINREINRIFNLAKELAEELPPDERDDCKIKFRGILGNGDDNPGYVDGDGLDQVCCVILRRKSGGGKLKKFAFTTIYNYKSGARARFTNFQELFLTRILNAILNRLKIDS